MKNENIDTFLSEYGGDIFSRAQKLRQVLIENLPGIMEQPDLPAKMIAYCYGQKYAELICVIIPSKKGLKLGFNRGTELPDPDRLLQGTGKISRYVDLKSDAEINSKAMKRLLTASLKAFKERVGAKK